MIDSKLIALALLTLATVISIAILIISNRKNRRKAERIISRIESGEMEVDENHLRLYHPLRNLKYSENISLQLLREKFIADANPEKSISIKFVRQYTTEKLLICVRHSFTEYPIGDAGIAPRAKRNEFHFFALHFFPEKKECVILSRLPETKDYLFHEKITALVERMLNAQK